MEEIKREIIPVLCENLVNILKYELKAYNRVNNEDYWMNFIRIVQNDNVELIFKLVPCPPKGKVCDFYFEHPTYDVHWHYMIYSKTMANLSSPVGKRGNNCIVWQFYSGLEENARLFFIKYGASKSLQE